MKKLIRQAKGDNKRDRSSSGKTLSRQESIPFTIVGIGASAGGLEALEKFLKRVPQGSGMAFVIVQHLDPTYKGIMPELLQRATTMEVFQVKDRTKVKPNRVYVIPPNKDMSILHGVLYLFEPTAARGLRLPIDFFLRSLAEDMQEQSIGVILSGMGSDGTLGLRAIKEKTGLALVQEPASAKFDSMPRSAINAGLADIVAPVEDLPGKIIDYVHHSLLIAKPQTSLEEKEQSSMEKVLILLRAKTGQDFSLYKKNTVYRRVERRMIIHKIDRIATYVRYLQENSPELELLFKELLIGVTNFFRDPEAWEKLSEEVIPALLKSRPAGGLLRAWSAGCSTGEEAYSLAIIFKEAIKQLKHEKNFTVQIFATDLDKDAIDNARQGVYPANIAADMSQDRLLNNFSKEERGYRINKDIREMVTFATQNIIMHPPFTKLDILICRNLLIYLTPELQKKLMPLFHYSLNPGGVLFLGSSETVGAFTNLFAPINSKARLYRRSEALMPAGQPAFPASFVSGPPGVQREAMTVKPAPNLQSLADQLLLQRFSPPAVLTNDKGDVLYISGRTGKYLEPAAGKANWNIFAMIREELRYGLGRAFQKAVRQKEPVFAKGLKVGEDSAPQIVDVTIQSISEPVALRGMVMIVFTDISTPPGMKAQGERTTGPPCPSDVGLLELQQELQQTRETLQSTNEEMQSSQEELISTNEELQSANEELQSTNEELTTSREEMQSLNEELQTVNAEQQSRIDELARTNNDMRNLLNSTEIVTVFLDNSLHIRRFTPGADKLFKLIPGDIGRPLSDVASDLHYPEITSDAMNVIRTLVFSEKQISATNGRWFKVRIMPYRTMEDVIGGVVITFLDITESKTLETALREEISRLKTDGRKTEG